MKTKKILIVTGGTGGHIYPAVALAQQMIREIPECNILFTGGGLSSNRYFNQETAMPSRTVACGSFVSKSPFKIIKSMFNISLGIWQSLAIIREFTPDVVVGFGSFYSFPPLVAAKLMSIPLVLHEANSIPGKVNKLLSKYATASTVHFPQTKELLKGNTIEVGMPLRDAFVNSTYTKEQAKRHYGLNPDTPVVLVFGGSQGAQIINHLAAASISHSFQGSQVQVIHIVGNAKSIESLQEGYTKNNIQAIVKPFEEQMAIAWRAADVVISRAGAGTIAEQLEFEVPGILIPFAGAADNHQEHNAFFMVEHVGGAKMLIEKQLNEEVLSEELKKLLDPDRAHAMRKAMQRYKQESRSQDLCSVVKEIMQ